MEEKGKGRKEEWKRGRTGGETFSMVTARLVGAMPGLLNAALRTGGDVAEVFYERTVRHRYRLRERGDRTSLVGEKPKVRAARRVEEGVGVRVMTDEAIGFAAVEGIEAEDVWQAADEAARRFGSGTPRVRAAPPDVAPDSIVLPADAPDVAGSEEKKALLQRAVEAAFVFDPRVRDVRVAYQDQVRRTLVATSEGVAVCRASMLLGLRVEVTLEAGGRIVKAYAVAGGTGPFGMSSAHLPEEVAREAVERADALAEAQPLKAGRLLVVLASGWGGVWLHEAVGHAFEIDNAGDRQRQIGQAVAPAQITLTDDATWPGGRGSFTYDDEGTPAQRTMLVENGVLRGLLTDRRHANRLGLPRTGNGRRQSFRHAPLPRMTNLLLAPGGVSEADLIADVQDGLYVKMPGHGLVWPGENRFAFDVLEGYRIEHGRLTHPVTDVRLTGSVNEALAQIVGVGSDVRVDCARGLCQKAGQTVPVSVGMPTVLLKGLEVSG